MLYTEEQTCKFPANNSITSSLFSLLSTVFTSMINHYSQHDVHQIITLRLLRSFCWEICKFSPSKTVYMHFCRLHKQHLDPSLTLNGTLIPVIEETKFLGLVFDHMLSFISHIKHLKKKCSDALNLLSVVASVVSYTFALQLSVCGVYLKGECEETEFYEAVVWCDV